MGEKRICRCRPRIGNQESAPAPRHGPESCCQTKVIEYAERALTD